MCQNLCGGGRGDGLCNKQISMSTELQQLKYYDLMSVASFQLTQFLPFMVCVCSVGRNIFMKIILKENN